MSGGSWLNQGKDAIGTTPGYMGPWEKLQLGWLDYQVVGPGKNTSLTLGPADRVVTDKKTPSGTLTQALIVPLPERTLTTKRNTPHSGSAEWWSGYGNDMTSTLARPIDLSGAKAASVDAWVQGGLEEDYDFLYGEVSTDNGKTWTQVGESVTNTFAWAETSWNLSAYAGEKVQFRFRVATDAGVASEAFLDDIAVSIDGVSTTDHVEGGAGAWTAQGFSIINGTTSRQVQDLYFAENRVYSGYDATLRTGPYNFGFANTRPDWVERFPYQNGLLVWFANGEYNDNNTSSHPGAGLVLPVDARPAPVVFPDGVKLGNRRQPFDATFGTEKTDVVTFHRNGVAVTVPSTKGIATFDDSNPNRYWTADNPWASTKVAGSGTSITVDNSSHHADQLKISVKFR